MAAAELVHTDTLRTMKSVKGCSMQQQSAMPAGRVLLSRPAPCCRKVLRVTATATMPPPTTTVDATKQVVAD